MTHPHHDAFDTVVLDVDGTLVDSVYSHVWSWREAFRVHGIAVPVWKIHRSIGMGGDRLVAEVTNRAVERSIGDQVREAQAKAYREAGQHLEPTPGASDLLTACKQRGLKIVLASSGSRDDTESAVALLETRHCIDSMVSGDDADATKPDTEPLERAVQSVGGVHAFVVGDATWDMESARRAGHAGVGVLTGGVAACELFDAGADLVFQDAGVLAAGLDEVFRLESGPTLRTEP